MKSWFAELESQLYQVINDSPITIDGKYFLIKDLYHNVENVYKEYLVTPDTEQIIENNVQDEETSEDFVLEKKIDENGKVSVTAEGKDIGRVMSEAFNALSINKEEEKTSSSEED